MPSSRIRPSVGCSTPAMIFISVDLPAPFSPTSTLTAPRRTSKFGVLDRDGAGIDLGDVLELQDDVVVRFGRHGSRRSRSSAGVTSGRSGRWPAADRRRAALTVLPSRPSRGSFDSTVRVDIGVERLAELREVDLVGEFVEIDEVEAVAQRRAAHGRADLHARVGLAVAIDIDVDGRRRATWCSAATIVPSTRGGIGPGRTAPACSGLPYFAAGGLGVGLGERRDLREGAGLGLQIGDDARTSRSRRPWRPD